MKQTILPIVVIVLSTLNLSCSSNDDSPSIDNPIEEIKEYNVTLSGQLRTDMCDIDTNAYSIKAEYLSDDEVTDSEEWQGSELQNINDTSILQGEVISIKVKLLNFNPQNANTGRGTALREIHLKIVDTETNEVLIDQDRIEFLLICTDTYYEILYQYNVETGILNSQVQTHAF